MYISIPQASSQRPTESCVNVKPFLGFTLIKKTLPQTKHHILMHICGI